MLRTVLPEGGVVVKQPVMAPPILTEEKQKRKNKAFFNFILNFEIFDNVNAYLQIIVEAGVVAQHQVLQNTHSLLK